MNGLLSRVRFGFDHRWTPPRVSPYLDGQLTRARRKRLERHVEECPECRELLRELRALLLALGTLRGDDGVPVAETILSSVRGRIDEPAQGGS